MMTLPTLLSIALLCAAGVVEGQQIVLDTIHNATTLQGTWSSGSMAVKTGANFVNPANQSFTYPATAGISYSFTNDGFYEIARYRFNGNGTSPRCITGVINWVHGTYQLLPNGSMVTVPFGDGFQQIQDPCGARSNFIEDYNITELYQSWRIFLDPIAGPKLHLFQFDGAPLAPMFQVSTTPNMLPTQILRNLTAGPPVFTTQNGLTNTGAISGKEAVGEKKSSAAVRSLSSVSVPVAGWISAGIVAATMGVWIL